MNMMRIALLCATVLCSTVSLAQVTATTPGWFAFPISPLDTSAALLDLSYLNEKPAGKNGFLRAQNGVIVDGTGKRMKFVGTNVSAGAAFVDKATSTRLARNLAKLGVNLVRLHHLDYNWGVGLINIPDNGQINAASLDKLDFLVSELKKQGIYVNLNLHVSREYAGTPPLFDFSKALDHFHAPYIEAFKKFTRALLTHRNPYTGLTYANEPAVMIIEVNNENATGTFDPLAYTTLPAALDASLRAQWMQWLRTKYVSTAALRAAWGLAGTPGASILANPNFTNAAAGWSLENNVGALATLGVIPGGVLGARWNATRAGSEDWALQLAYPGLNAVNGGAYRLSFRARANAARDFSVAFALDQAPYSFVGLARTAQLTTAWQTFAYDFTVSGTVANHSRVLFSMNNRLGTIDLADVKVQPLPRGVLLPTQTLEANNVPYTAASINTRAKRDFVQFLVDIEHRHAEEARRYVKVDLAAKQMVNHSQMGFGGMAAGLREKPSDLADNHAYWEHPQFPGTPFDLANWTVSNTSQLANPTGGELAGLALARMRGKPYTVSEYGLPAPSDFSAETWPGLAVMGAFQDWDALYHFTLADTPSDYTTNRMVNWFQSVGHPGVTAFMPSAAIMFRTNQIQPGRSLVTLTAARGPILTDQATNGMWASFDRFWRTQGLTRKLALRHRVAIDVLEGSSATTVSSKPVVGEPVVSDTNEITWSTTQATMTLNTPQARVAMGKIGNRTLSLGDVRVQVGNIGGNQHAHLTLVALDNKPLATSTKVLLTALGRAENQNMRWNATRTSVGSGWGNGPVMVQAVPATLTLPGGPWKIQALNATGNAQSTVAASSNTLTLSAAHKSPWYLLTKVVAPVQ
jgi:hypothetical protein